MNETQYQMDLLKAMNRNLSVRDRMYRMICEVSGGAFLYFEAGKTEIVTIGDWSDYFDVDVADKRDLEKIYEIIDEPFVMQLRELMQLEKSGKESQVLECLTRKKNAWYRFQAKVSYDPRGNYVDKVIGIFNVTKYRLQAEELNYYSFYDVITGLYNRNYFIPFWEK